MFPEAVVAAGLAVLLLTVLDRRLMNRDLNRQADTPDTSQNATPPTKERARAVSNGIVCTTGRCHDAVRYQRPRSVSRWMR